MTQTLTFLFCEGKHEPPFIHRLLKSDGWKNKTDQAIEKYPSVLQRYLLGELNKYSKITNSVSWSRKIGYMPWYVLLKKQNKIEHFIVIWDTGGESNYTVMKEVLTAFKVINEFSDFEEIKPVITNIALFYDADKSIEKRITTVEKNLSNILPKFCKSLTSDKNLQTVEKSDNFNKIGLFIFANSEGSGTLEDYIIPLMEKNNEPIFEAAKKFIGLTESKRQEKKWSEQKALIGITGQLQKSGKSNAVIITDCDYITDEKIKEDKNAQQLIEFIQKIIDKTIQMNKYKTTKQLNLPEIDAEVLKFWEENKVFEQSVANREGKETYVFYEGPPSANGKPGIHHVMGRAIKDIFCRFNTMKGYQVNRKGGWDTHGLPIELQVEKELGITKEDIGTKISVDDYNKACRETVMRYKDLWDDITVKMGYWVDLNDPYITFENNYIESVWWLLKRLYDKDLLYKGYTIQPYSPAAGTGLSSHELNQPGCYRNVKDTSAVAQFMVKRNEKSEFLYENLGDEAVHFIAWTTTPWTLPSNTGLAVGGKIDYVLVKTFNKYTNLPINVILAKALLNKWFSPKDAELKIADYKAGDKNIPFEVIGEYKGADLELIEYHQLLPYQQPETGDAFKVLVGDFVSTEDGTGIVHLAPSFGADDKRVADKYGIGALTLVDKQGKFVEGVGEFSGRYVKNYKDEPEETYVSVDVDIAIKLKTENKAFDVKKYEHNYPHCWRTDKPVLYYPLDSWFIKAASVRDRMQELNNTINWKPKSTGEGRFGKWLENLQDWNLSRSRFWGIPLPIWRTISDTNNPDSNQDENTAQLCIGSIEQLAQEIEKANAALGLNQSVPKDLHRPYIDDVILVSDDGRPMKRELDLIDVWFDSGAMPYAQWHYPFENKEKFEQNYPANFIAEGVDQTRGWFYTLHAIATMAFDSVAFKNVVSNGLVLDKNGVKMSKSKGNGIDPFETIEAHGADATRWYMISNSQPWDNLKFDPDGLVETRNKFFGTLFNTFNFFVTYAEIDNFTYAEKEISHDSRPEIDRWIITKLYKLIHEVQKDYLNYEPTNAARKIEYFVTQELSNWYVRLNRKRFWKGALLEEKVSGFQVLYKCLIEVTKLMAPIAPFFSDWLYTRLNSVTKKQRITVSYIDDNGNKCYKTEVCKSVHLAPFPFRYKKRYINEEFEIRMDYAQRISSLILSLRKKNKLRVRQPLQKILLPVLNEAFIIQVDSVKDLILQEVNVKEIEYVTDTSGIIKKGVKPNFATLGRRLGKNMKAGKALIDAMTQEDIANLEANQKFPLVIEGETFELEMEDFVITSEDLEGWLVANDKDLTVALDIALTTKLLAEGMAREIVNRIQNLRKSKNFDVTDKITIIIKNDKAIQSAVNLFGDYIKDEVLADNLMLVENIENGEIIDLVDEVSFNVLIERVSVSESFSIIKDYAKRWIKSENKTQRNLIIRESQESQRIDKSITNDALQKAINSSNYAERIIGLAVLEKKNDNFSDKELNLIKENMFHGISFVRYRALEIIKNNNLTIHFIDDLKIRYNRERNSANRRLLKLIIDK